MFTDSPLHFPSGPPAAVRLALDRLGSDAWTAAVIVGSVTRLMTAPWREPICTDSATDRVVLMRSGQGGLGWPDWHLCLHDLQLVMGAQPEVVDVITISGGYWRSVVCADLSCCPIAGTRCAEPA